MKKTILYCVLDWGLGHATRSIPVIRALLEGGHRVVLASSGRSLVLLRDEFPECLSVALPDYGIRYARNARMLIPFLLLRVPSVFVRIAREHRAVERLVRRLGADLVISDNRYGCFSRRVPSFFMTHQLRFQPPRGLEWSAFLSEWFNRFFFRFYRLVLIPDVAGTPNLSGALSHSGRIAGHPKLRYIGPLSSLTPGPPIQEDLDVLFLVSGPEPQRSLFEAILLRHASALPGRKMIVLGKPGSSAPLPDIPGRGLEIRAHLNRKAMATWMRRSRWIVCRSGYSTVMEVAALAMKAILVPTPGQTEQEYLARYYTESGLFFCVPQAGLSLPDALDEAGRFYSGSRPAIPVNRTPDLLLLLDSPS
ncbi:MAG TPA: hypothetical protein ENN17_04485 [bacterium]|nr:hypothetical protein [bacterium]